MEMAFRSAEQTDPPTVARKGLDSVDFILNILELLADTDRPRALSDIARSLRVSKPRAHRHLRALLQRGYVRQESDTERYEITAKLLALGEAVRDRFDIARVVRPSMSRLRDATGQTVTASTLIADQVTIIEMIHGRTLVEFGVRPGGALDPFASAHGLVALAFGPADRIARSWTGPSPKDPDAVTAAVALVAERGWATAANGVLVGVNALAAPIFGHQGEWRGTIAIVGSTSFIRAEPAPAQIRDVLRAAREVSRQLGSSKDRA
jgi:IclR family acetate operon transcriptional repressor